MLPTYPMPAITILIQVKYHNTTQNALPIISPHQHHIVPPSRFGTGARGLGFMRYFSLSLIFALVLGLLCPTGAQKIKTLGVRPKTGEFAGTTFYTNSHALIIGIGQYPNLPRDKQLDFAEKDAKDLRTVLVRSYGFLPENVTLLLGPQATKKGIEDALSEMAESNRVKADDRVLVYFSCHGQTVTLSNGGAMGFLIPHDAKVNLDQPNNAGPYLASCISMRSLWEKLEASPAKHRLLIADACFGGILAKGRNLSDERPNRALINTYLSRPALQIMTAGGAKEETFEDPKLGHGVFTHYLLEELKAQAGNADFVFTAAELGETLKRQVGNTSGAKQNPQFANKDTEGEFLFVTTNAGKSKSTDETPAPPMGKKKPEGGKVEVEETEGELAITTLPAGAKVLIDGVDTGKRTPVTLKFEVAQAERVLRVRLELEDYKPLNLKATLERGKQTEITQTLVALRKESMPAPKENGNRGKIGEIEGKTGLKFVSIPSGSFDMGSENGESDEKPVRRVRLNGFSMSENVVTVAQYEAYCKAMGKAMPTIPSFNADWSKKDHPIVNVSWEDAKGYCAWAGVDLPTEAEWEYAARGGLAGKKFPWGDEFDGSKLQHSVGKSAGGTSSVGSYEANGYGLYDMAGNVWQWCSDRYGSYNAQDTDNPHGINTGTVRVLRGGSWLTFDPDNFRCASRIGLITDFRSTNDGFRVVFRGLR